MRQRQGDGYQQRYGEFHRNDWGHGDTESVYAVGDIVWLPENCAALLSERVASAGLHRIVAVFSIGEDAAFYYRVSTVTLGGPRATKVVTDNGENSGRVHVIPGQCDYTAGWSLVHAADRSEHRAERTLLGATVSASGSNPAGGAENET